MELSVNEISNLLGVNRTTVYRLHKKGLLRAYTTEAIRDYIYNLGFEEGRVYAIKELKTYGWIRRKPIPSKRDLLSPIYPWAIK